MKKIGLATIVAGGLAAATLGLAAPAVAAPSGPGNAQETINDLKADGYNVIEIDDPDDQKAGILRRYHVTEPDGMPIAIIEVRRCRKERHV